MRICNSNHGRSVFDRCLSSFQKFVNNYGEGISGVMGAESERLEVASIARLRREWFSACVVCTSACDAETARKSTATNIVLMLSHFVFVFMFSPSWTIRWFRYMADSFRQLTTAIVVRPNVPVERHQFSSHHQSIDTVRCNSVIVLRNSANDLRSLSHMNPALQRERLIQHIF